MPLVRALPKAALIEKHSMPRKLTQLLDLWSLPLLLCQRTCIDLLLLADDRSCMGEVVRCCVLPSLQSRVLGHVQYTPADCVDRHLVRCCQ